FSGATNSREGEAPAKLRLANDVGSAEVSPGRLDFWRKITRGVRLAAPHSKEVSQIQDALAWFARDAVVHLSTPRGLEQANGGAWGVRDVCQGPVEFLLSYDHAVPAADILRRLFSRQFQERCDWPQWFGFPPFQDTQAPDAHGDIL